MGLSWRGGTAIALIGAALAGSTQEGERATALELLEALGAEPRIVGTPGYTRALERVARELAAAGIEYERETLDVTRAIPTRSDVLLFDDGVQASAFAGLRERWDAEAALPRPAAYDWNAASADVRGPIVDVGAGELADIQVRVSQRVTLEGAVWLVSVPRVPAERLSTIRELANRAHAGGALGLIVAPADAPDPGHANDFVLATSAAEVTTPAPIPVVPIRSLEARAIAERLRVKRVRGDEGAVSVKVGPGPVEARLVVECPAVQVEGVELLTVTIPGDTHMGIREVHVPIDERPGMPLGGAAIVAAAVSSASIVDFPVDSGLPVAPGTRPHRRYLFGPVLTEPRDDPDPLRLGGGLRFTPETQRALAGAIEAASELGKAVLGGRYPVDSAHLERSALAPALGETPRELDERLGGTLTSRADAAATVIAYASVRASGRAPLEALRRLTADD